MAGRVRRDIALKKLMIAATEANVVPPNSLETQLHPRWTIHCRTLNASFRRHHALARRQRSDSRA